MITGINFLRIFSVMMTDCETNFTDSDAKITDLKLIEGALLSLSHHFSINLPLLLSLSTFTCCSSLLFALFRHAGRAARFPVFAKDLQAFEVAVSGLWSTQNCQISGIGLGFSGTLGRNSGLWITQNCQISCIFLGFSGILGRIRTATRGSSRKEKETSGCLMIGWRDSGPVWFMSMCVNQSINQSLPR